MAMLIQTMPANDTRYVKINKAHSCDEYIGRYGKQTFGAPGTPQFTLSNQEGTYPASRLRCSETLTLNHRQPITIEFHGW